MPYANDKDRKHQQNNYYEVHKEEILARRKNYRLNNRDKIKEGKLRWRETSSKCKYGEIKKSAKARELEFNLTYQEYLILYWMQNCFYCPATDTKGIDRIDNNKGYILSNCVPCCCTCNLMKLDHDFNDFINHINSIHTKSSTYRID